MRDTKNFEIEDGVLIAYHGKSRVVKVPQGVTILGKGAFCENKHLREVHLPEGVQKIEQFCFSRCVNLKYVHCPQSLEEIAQGAFLRCQRLESPEFPIFDLVDGKKVGGLRQIGGRAFYGCKRIKSLSLPMGMVGVGDEAFGMCTALSFVSIRSNLAFTEGVDTKPTQAQDYTIGAGKHLFDGAPKKLIIMCISDPIPAHWHAKWNYNPLLEIYCSVVYGCE